MRRSTVGLLVMAALLAASGCGGDESSGSAGQPSRHVTPSGDANRAAKDQAERDRAMATDDEDAATTRRKGTTVRIRNSPFGKMLFNSRRQAIYIFQNDGKGKTVCYGECAEAWPPVLTRGKPVAGKGVEADLLGTIERRDGTLQVTYADQPLYYYANEGPGEVLCHNVNLNGGLWWVVGPDGKRRP